MNRSLPRRSVPRHPLRRLASAVALVIPIATASCAVGPPGASADRVEPSPAAATTPSPAPSSATPAPSASPAPSATTSPAEPVATPPAASLSAEGGDPVVGQLGSYTWGGGGSDSPWLPGAPVSVGAREPLTVTIAGDPPVSQWTARRTRADATNAVGAVPVGSGSGPIAIDAPASGSWTLAVSVTFAGERGSATWSWRLDVR